MITIFKNKKDIPQDMEYVELNDIYFNQNTALKLDDKAEEIIETVDGAKLISKFKMRSKFNDIVLDVDKKGIVMLSEVFVWEMLQVHRSSLL